MKNSSKIALSFVAVLGIGGAAQAQTASNILGAPLVAAGNGVNGAAAAHAGIAPVVNAAAPSAENVTDGVTNAVAAVGAGVTGSGQRVQSDGLLVGQTSNGQPLVSVGATAPGNQGRVASVLGGRP